MPNPIHAVLKITPCIVCETTDGLKFSLRAVDRNQFVTSEKCRECSGVATHQCSGCSRSMNRTRKVTVRGVTYRCCRKCLAAVREALEHPWKDSETRGFYTGSKAARQTFERMMWAQDLVGASTPEERGEIKAQVQVKYSVEA